MAIFLYTALDATNSFVKGTIESSGMKDAAAKLEKEGFIIVNIHEERRKRFGSFNVWLSGVSAQEKIFFTRNLYTMLESGISLDYAVKTTAEQTTNSKFREILMAVYDRIQKGQPLNVALVPYRNVFKDYYINLIGVGEKSGRLDEVLSYLLEKLEKDQELLTKARGAMIYPAIILIALVIMVSGMLVFVIPRITSVLGQYNVALPLTTRIVIALSNFLMQYGVYCIPVVVGLGYLAYRVTRKGRGRWAWNSFVLKLYRINTVVKEYNLARFARSTSALLRSGIGLDQALEMTAGVSSNSHYEKVLMSSIRFVQRGIPLSEVLKGSPKLFPPLTTRMVEVGERSGKLDHMLTRLAVFYEKSVETSLTNLSAVIEPILLLCIGFAVGFVAIAVLTPIWSFSRTV